MGNGKWEMGITEQRDTGNGKLEMRDAPFVTPAKAGVQFRSSPE
jgi:hypothetical protein